MSFEMVSLSTADLPDRDRDEMIREFYGKIAQRLEIDPHGEETASIETAAMIFPDLMVGAGSASSITGARTKAMRADGGSDVLLSFMRHGAVICDGGDATVIQPRDVLLTALDHPFSLTLTEPTNSFLTLQVSRRALRPLVPDLDGLTSGSLSIDRPGVRLLESYLTSVSADPPASPVLRDLASRHLVELAALALGPSTQAAEMARGGGVRAARLVAAKAVITRNLDSPGLSALAVAAQLGVSPRYLHMLFDGEPLSFAEFVTDRRLARACALLADPARRHWRILDIAFEVGFGDIGAFNRAFRRRRDMTPSEFRRNAQARP